MKITERQEKILNTIVKEYIDSAWPVSSQLLEKKYDFEISPATIRIEMQKLAETGLLCQPHTSAGRVPTDKGYRFYVDNLLEKQLENLEIGDWFGNKIEGVIKFNQPPEQQRKGKKRINLLRPPELQRRGKKKINLLRPPERSDGWRRINILRLVTKNLALASSALALSYLPEEKILWKEGWEEILREPEVEEKNFISNFTKLLENFEKNIEDLKINSGIKIYIGRENPFPKAKDFSIICSRCYFPDEREAVVSLLGPKRMNYDRNIGLINSLAEALAEAFN